MPGTWIQTATGGRLFYDPIDVSQVKIRDVALGLARECRFNGQISQLVDFYSVAEHSWWCSHLAPPGHRLAALVHDAAEAFTKDIVRPFKQQLDDYRAYEERFEDALWRHFCWPNARTEIVKRVDRQILVAERAQLCVHGRGEWNPADEDDEMPNVTLEKWLPSRAWVMWEQRYLELTEFPARA